MRRLLAATPTILFFLAAAAFGCFQLIDTDLWLHLRTGEWIVGSMRVPREDFFSYTAAGKPWIDAHWLAQAALWLVYAAGGAVGLCLLRLAVVLAIFALLYRCCRRWAGPGPTILVLTLSLLVVNDRFLMKPDLLALLLAVCFIVILEGGSGRGHSRLWALVPLQIVWVNMHPSFLLGPFLILAYAVDAWAPPSPGCRPASGKGNGGFVHTEGTAGERRAVRKRLLLILLLSVLCCLVNPYGVSLLGQPWEQVSSPLYREHIIPWKPAPTSFPAPFSPFFFKAMLVLCVAAILLNLRALRPAHAVTIASFCFLAVRSQRHLALFGLLCAPGLAYNLAPVARAAGERFPAAARRLAPAGLAALSIALCLLIAGVASGEYYWRQRSMKRFGLGGSRIAYPDDAADFLASSGFEGRVFCNYDAGSWFAARFHPRCTVFIDGRNLVYGEALLREYLRAVGSVGNLEAAAERHGVGALFLSHAARDVKNLLPSLWRSERWRPVYADDRAVVFFRAGRPGAPPAVETGECRIPMDPSCDRFPVTEMRAAEFFSTLGLDRCARAMLLLALGRRRDIPEAHNHLGVLAMKAGDIGAARAEFLEACRMSRTYVEPRINLAIASLQVEETSQAVREARDAVRLETSNARAHGTLGLALLRAGDVAGAMREVSEAVRLDPGDAELHSNLGVLFRNSGDTERALAEYEAARALARDYFAPRFNLGLLHAERGDVDRAVEMYREAIAIDPRHAGARRNLAILYLGRGDLEKAREQLAAARRVDPGGRATGERPRNGNGCEPNKKSPEP